MLGWFEKNNKISLVITILIAAIIFYLSSLTFKGVSLGDSSTISYHFFAFFFLALFLQISLLKGQRNYKLFILVLILAMVYGISDEIHQLFVPGRSCSILDAAVDIIGIFTSSILYLVSILIRNKK